MANTLKIYKTQITPSRNALLDDIEGYLESIERKTSAYTGNDALTYTESDFQFVKPDLDVNIKIAVAKNNNNLFDSIGNYARIEQSQDDGTRSVWYYFIISSKWTAKSTLELTLSMDTVNTFSNYLLNEDNWSDKTSITREHKDRVRYTGNHYVKQIDRTGEGISVPYYVKTDDTKIEEPNSTGTPEWYLVYKTKTAAVSEGGTDASSNGLDCYIYPKTEIKYKQNLGLNSSAVQLTPDNFTGPTIYGINYGSVSWTNATVRGYMQGASMGIPWITPNATLTISGDVSANNSFSEIRLSGRVAVGDNFKIGAKEYTCYEIIWTVRNIDGNNYMSLPIGIFKCSTDNKPHYAIYVESYNGKPINNWMFIMSYKVGDYLGGNAGVIWLNETEEEKESPFFVVIASVTLKSMLLADTEYTEDNFWGRTFDTNWVDNLLLVVEQPEFTFSASVPAIYNLEFGRYTPSVAQLTSGNVYYTTATAGVSSYLNSIDTLDRADSKLVKILAIPYCPTAIELEVNPNNAGDFTISFDDNILELDEVETVENRTYGNLRYKNLNASFGKDLLPTAIDFSVSDEFNEYYFDDKITTRNIDNESKLLHSDFYKDTFVYDNVSKVIRREDILTNNEAINVVPYYQPTNTIDSNMMFKFNINNADYKQITDWDNVLISTRSNELPIYNNDYLNYIRYGYGAEKSNLEATTTAQRTSQAISSTLAVAGGTVGGALAGAKFGVPGAIIGGVIGLGTSLLQSYSSNLTTETNIANAQRSLESKIEQLQNSAATVKNGFSGVDLMTNYTGNRLHYITYDTVDLLKDAIYDRFHYCGYSSPTQAKPHLYSRRLFNYLQCEPVFIDEATNAYNYYLTDIKERFTSGVTLYHEASEYLDSSELMYNWNQNLENWENLKRKIPVNFEVKHEAEDSYLGYIDYKNVGYYDTTAFIPRADNNFRYKITYQLADSPDRLKWFYNTPEDIQNGYTLNNVIDLTKLDNYNLAGNGTKVYVQVIDITGEWEDSNEVVITLNQTICESSTEALKLVLYKDDYFYDEATETKYWIWRKERVRLATKTQFPEIGDPLYKVVLGPDEYTPYKIQQQMGTVSKFTAFLE